MPSKKSPQRQLGLGYSTPIIGAVVALLLGLVVSDLTRTTLDIWIWVLIQAILGTGMVLGTRFSTAAFNAAGTRKKLGAVKGARNLNLVLGIIWSAVVTVMAFALGAQSVNKLLLWPTAPKEVLVKDGNYTPAGPNILPLTSSRFLQDFVPAFVLIVISVVGIYLLLAERSRQTNSAK